MHIETIHKKQGEHCDLVLKNRISAGLALMYEVDMEGIVSISRLKTAQNKNLKPGDAIQVGFRIQTQKKGTVKILFYETQPWNKNFHDIPVKEIIIHVK
ncbi:MAG: hypothetical protein ABUK01_03950 [Leptospirales bacterium]